MIRKIRNSRRYYLSESVTVSEFRDNQTRPPVSSSLLLTNVTSRGIVVVENINLIEEAGMYEEYSAPAFYSLSFLPPPLHAPEPPPRSIVLYAFGEGRIRKVRHILGYGLLRSSTGRSRRRRRLVPRWRQRYAFDGCRWSAWKFGAHPRR